MSRQVFERKVLDLNRLIAEIEKMLRRLIGEDIDLVTASIPRWRMSGRTRASSNRSS